ncbi:MAG: hypothetical protein GY797_34480 [Deltaproteobacteria bacterium]|nr:hypothetical protein [Deltaproteobacteria bacterium]
MRKNVLIIGLFLLITCTISFVGVYKLLLELQIRNVRVLGWEDDRYLWTVGMFGNTRWDVNQQVIINRTFQPDKINQIFVSQEGEVWGYGHGVWLFETDEWIDVGEIPGLQRGKIYDMVQTNDGTIWIATWHGFKTWNRETKMWESTKIDEPGWTMAQSFDDTLWFGLTEDGVIQLQPDGQLTHWTTSNGLVDNRVRSILPANDGKIWIGTSSGVSHWSGHSWQSWNDLGYPDPDGLRIYKFLETKDGAIWADTSQDFARWKQGQWTTYERSPFCSPNLTFLETDGGNLWAGCPTGLFRWTGSNWREYGQSEGANDNSFVNLIEGSNGILYAHIKNGLYQYNPDQDIWIPFP